MAAVGGNGGNPRRGEGSDAQLNKGPSTFVPRHRQLPLSLSCSDEKETLGGGVTTSRKEEGDRAHGI